ncbi:MAG TPA: cysteine desulfurase-like protein [Acidimicrobiia bacterium]|nr:cysteine desulfurase-like protein [Acidimicrobiia bacterium]
MSIDVARLRRQFPALSARSDGVNPVFVDGPAGTQVHESVVAAVSAHLVSSASNVGGGFPASENSTDTVRLARQAAGDLLGGSPDEVVFGPNMTTLTFAFSRAVARTWAAGDRIIVSGLDHDANVTPWVMAAADRSVEVDFIDIDRADMSLDLDHLDRLLTEGTRLVAVTGASNTFGTMVDVSRVASAARGVGALCFVDGVHLAPHIRIDASTLGVDAIVCSAYKFFGPHVGSMWVRQELLAALEPYKVRPAPSDGPGRFETGTPSFALLAGYTAAVDYLASLGSGPDRASQLYSAFAQIRGWEETLGRRFLDGLGRRVAVYGRGSMDGRVSTFAVRVPGESPQQTVRKLAARGIYAWAGHNYAIEPVSRAGLADDGGVVRIGFLHLNTEGEVDRVLEALLG